MFDLDNIDTKDPYYHKHFWIANNIENLSKYVNSNFVITKNLIDRTEFVTFEYWVKMKGQC